MTNSVWDIIAGTPWWVFVLLIYLIRIGYDATKPSIVELKKLFILPAVLIGLSAMGIYTLTQHQPINLLVTIAALLFGIPLGWVHYKLLKIKAVPDKKQLHIPGTWSVLVLILLIFAVKYYTGYQMDVNPEVLLKPQNAIKILALYGLFIGLFIGRLAYSCRCLKYGPFV